MIYTRFGLAVNVIGNCGQHTLDEWSRSPVTLLKLEVDNIIFPDEKNNLLSVC